MDIAVFDPTEIPFVLGAVRAVDPDPLPEKERFLQAIARLHGVELDPRDLPALRPEETAAIIVDPHRRKRLLQLAMVMTTIDGNVDKEPAASISALAEALGVDERGVGTLHRMAAHHDRLARFDLLRRVGARFMRTAWRDEKLGGVRKLLAAGLGSAVEDPALVRRMNRLGLLPEGSFGRSLWEHLVSRDFAFPGQRDGIPEMAFFHDLGHVLSGYDTDPDGEIQQAAFQAGFVRNDGFMFLFFAIAQFHLGMKITPIADAYVGRLDIDKLMAALARGAACKVDLSDRWDFWPHMPRPLAEVRAELGIPPLA